MDKNEVKKLVIEAYDDYCNATYSLKTAKLEKKREIQVKIDSLYGRVKNVFAFYPELCGFE